MMALPFHLCRKSEMETAEMYVWGCSSEDARLPEKEDPQTKLRERWQEMAFSRMLRVGISRFEDCIRWRHQIGGEKD